MKIKTLVPNVLVYGNEAGKELEVNKTTGEHLMACGVAEPVKEPAKQEVKKAPKKTAKK